MKEKEREMKPDNATRDIIPCGGPNMREWMTRDREKDDDNDAKEEKRDDEAACGEEERGETEGEWKGGGE